MSRNAWLIGALIAVASAAASAGPFGLNAGDTVESISKFAKLEPTESEGIYVATRLPDGHQDIEVYELMIGPRTGLCKISALTPERETNVYGDRVLSDFNTWQEALKSKYGAPSDKFDFLREGSKWNKPTDWTTALYKRERRLATYWEGKTASADKLAIIVINAVATDDSHYTINLLYEFTNFEACRASLRAKRNANL
jgi:hypothetical protein